jgi:ABC-2 type transport system permease protein
MVVVAAYLAAIDVVGPMLAGEPMSATGKILAMIPFISPVIMPAAMTTNSVALWQWLLAVALTLCTGILAAWIAARIYSNSVLRIGSRVKLREAFAGERRIEAS